MAVFTLTKRNKFYDRANGSNGICVDFVARRLKSRPKQINLSFRDRNPRRTGWTKAYYDGYMVHIGTRSSSDVSPSTEMFLDDNVGKGYFWFKLETVK